MIINDASLRRLVVEAGLAAVNNNLYGPAETILKTLPLLTDNLHARTILAATFHIGLNDMKSAYDKLCSDHSPEGDLLRELIAQPRYPHHQPY